MRYVSLLVLFSAVAAAQSTPTFSKDVAPVLYKNCASCHRPGDIAPMPLLTYEKVRPWAKSIREKVSLGQMPPWHSDAPRGTFSNDRRLTDAERDTLIRWASNGAPQGNLKDLPPVPKFTEGWEIGQPDVVIGMTKPFEVPESGTINYQYITVPTNFTEDKWVQAIEVRPGARKVVHHILVFCREAGTPAVKPAAVFTTVVPKMALNNESLSGGRGALLATTAPGTNAVVFPRGT